MAIGRKARFERGQHVARIAARRKHARARPRSRHPSCGRSCLRHPVSAATHRRVLMDGSAQACRLTRQRTSVVQRVEVERALVENRLMILRRDEELLHLLTRQVAKLQSELALLVFACSLQSTARVVTQRLRNAGHRMRIPDAEFVDIAAARSRRLPWRGGKAPVAWSGPTRARWTESPVAITCRDETAVAAGGTPGHALAPRAARPSARCARASRLPSDLPTRRRRCRHPPGCGPHAGG